ncbi:4'-phosphopantetheinyl transferase [Streptomyces sp. NPDC058583]|uniref:4'-phosphopantetheinyl transferase family protein n=1 Tax=unclassified Streptomyces TaxID=2593676 RepID=UPI003651D382
MIERILPSAVMSSDSYGDPPRIPQDPREALVVSRAVASRRREFATARWCARRALSELGVPPVPLLPGPHGAPRWPDAVVGSITHCAGYRAAAVAHAARVRMLGIDAEPHAPLPRGVLESICLPEERIRVRDLTAADPGVHWDRVLFCLKETVYKSWYPATGQRLEFEDARISVDPAARTFSARILVASPLRQDGRPVNVLTGRWLAGDGLVVAAIAVLRAG